MAYRRRHGITRSATFVEDHRSSSDSSSPATASPRATRFADDSRRPDRSAPSASLAAQVIRASAARWDLSVSPAYPEPFLVSSSTRDLRRDPAPDPVTHEHTSVRSTNEEPKHGLWGVVAQKAKAILDENGSLDDYDSTNQHLTLDSSGGTQPSQSRWSYERVRKSKNPTLLKVSGAEAKLDMGGKIKNALEEGLTMVDSRTAGVLQDRKLHIRRKASSFDLQNLKLSAAAAAAPDDLCPELIDQETQLKASRDVANAMAAKAKLLMRELKTVKADLAFARERCAQLEEENRMLRDGDHHADEDLIRRQLETLLAEKARLAHENTVYARENRILREIVEFHQPYMQDVVYLEEGMEDDVDDDDDAEPYDFHIFSPSRRSLEVAFPAAIRPQSPSRYPGDIARTPRTGSPSPSPQRMSNADSSRRVDP